MTRQFIAALLSLSLAMTAMTTAPARANEDIGKIIAGLAVLGILSQVVKNNNKPEVTRQQPHRKVHKPRKKRHVKIAPQRCLREQWTHRGTRDVYGAKCMKRHSEFHPPRNCKRVIETRNGTRRFYAPNCLRKNGWRA